MRIKILSMLIFSIVIFYVCISNFYQVSPTVTSSYFQNIFNINEMTLAKIVSAYFITYSIMQIPNGILIDRFGISKVLPMGLTLTVIGSIVSYYANSTALLAFSRLLIGLGCSCAFVGALYIAATYFKAILLPILIGLTEAISTLGYILATNSYSAAINRYGFYTTEKALIIINLIILITLSLLLKLRAHKHSIKNNIKLSEIFKNGISLFKKPIFTSIIIYTFFTWMQIMTFAGYWGKRYFEIMHDYSKSHALFLMGVFWAGYLIMSLLVGPLSRNFFSKKTLLFILSFIGVCTSIIITLPILYSYTTLVSLIFLLGTSIAGIILGFSIISEVAPSSIRGSAIATNNTVLVLGGLFGQYLFGLLLTYDGLIKILPTEINPYYYSAILLLPISAIIAFLAILYGTRRYSK